MRVLEIGSGAGDVALMLAELVGQEGQVGRCRCQFGNSENRTPACNRSRYAEHSIYCWRCANACFGG